MADTSFYTQRPETPSFLEMAGQASQVANAMQQNKLLQTQNQQTQIDLVKGQVDTLVNGFSSLASKPNLNVGDFQELGSRLVEQGVISPEVFAAETSSLPPNATPEQLRQIATGYALRALSAGERFTSQFGTPGMIDTGNAQIPVTSSPLTGVHPIGPAIPNQLSPSQLAQPVPIGVTPDNRQIIGTTGQFLEQAGVNPLTAQPSAPAVAPAANPLIPQQAEQAPPQQLPALSAPGVLVTPPPGAVEADTAVGQQSGQQFSQDLARASNFQQAVLPLEKAIPVLERLGTTGTGPGREELNNIFSFLQSMGVPGLDAGGIKDFDEAKKYLIQYASRAGDTTTNDKLAAAFAGNPNTDMSNAAAIDVAKTALTISRLENAQVRAFELTGLPVKDYARWASEFNSSQDPRAYGLDLMSADKRTELINSLKGEDRARFANSLRTAIQLGLVTPPQQGTPANGQ